jgi:hypothetical protein
MNIRLRFQILERDRFRCQYCGARAPDVDLEVDHIVSVAAGGSNSPLNLITACFQCNRGKKEQSQPKFAHVAELWRELARLDYDWMSSRLRPVVNAVVGVLWELDAVGEALEAARTAESLEDWVSLVLRNAAEDLQSEAVRWTNGEIY